MVTNITGMSIAVSIMLAVTACGTQDSGGTERAAVEATPTHAPAMEPPGDGAGTAVRVSMALSGVEKELPALESRVVADPASAQPSCTVIGGFLADLRTTSPDDPRVIAAVERSKPCRYEVPLAIAQKALVEVETYDEQDPGQGIGCRQNVTWASAIDVLREHHRDDAKVLALEARWSRLCATQPNSHSKPLAP